MASSCGKCQRGRLLQAASHKDSDNCPVLKVGIPIALRSDTAKRRLSARRFTKPAANEVFKAGPSSAVQCAVATRLVGGLGAVPPVSSGWGYA